MDEKAAEHRKLALADEIDASVNAVIKAYGNRLGYPCALAARGGMPLWRVESERRPPDEPNRKRGKRLNFYIEPVEVVIQHQYELYIRVFPYGHGGEDLCGLQTELEARTSLRTHVFVRKTVRLGKGISVEGWHELCTDDVGHRRPS